MPATAGINPAEDDSNKLSDDIRYTPKWLRVSAGWGWRLLVVVAVVFLFWQLGSLLSQLTVPLLLAVLLTSGLQLALLYVPALSGFFGTAPLSGPELLICVGVSLVFFVVLELDKLRILWGHHRHSDTP